MIRPDPLKEFNRDNIKKVISKRGKITKLSHRAKQLMRFVADDFLIDLNAILPLTYSKEFPTNGKEVNRDYKIVRDYLRRYIGFNHDSHVYLRIEDKDKDKLR